MADRDDVIDRRARPRLVKIVRDKMGPWLADEPAVYRRITDPEIAVRELRKKLGEEVVEYLLDPCVGELADVLDVCRALANRDLGISWAEVENEAAAKGRERGTFHAAVGMYVQTLAGPRHEGDKS